MGLKGSRHTTNASDSVEEFCARINFLSGISNKKMFGGYGVFHEGKMFALVNSDGEIFLKCDDSVRQKFEQHDAKTHGRMPYLSLPRVIFDDPPALKQWIQESINISK